MAQRKSFGRLMPDVAAQKPAPPDDHAPAGGADVDYDWLTQPVREGVASDAGQPDLIERLVHLFTRSPYRRWLWIFCGIAAFLFIQFVGFGGMVWPERSGSDYVAGNRPREAAHIVDFTVDGDGFHEASSLMAENLEVGGTIVNTTDETIWQVTLRAVVHDCAGDQDVEECPVAWDGVLTMSIDVPPGETLELDETVPVAKLPVLQGEPWAEYEMLAVSTR